MTKKQQISELKRMVNRTIIKFKGKDKTTKEVNRLLGNCYLDLCTAFNIAHGWKLGNEGMSVVRYNILTRPNYSPYCGASKCSYGILRTSFDGKQFSCKCGWQSGFEPEFIEQYKAKWGIQCS